MGDNPLSEEQIKKINEISKLNPEEQKKELPLFLATLNEEQVSFLKNQQGGECLFCSISEKKIDSYKVYEDEKVMGVLDINPANKGHVIVFPKKHFQFMGELNEDLNGHMFNVANKLSSKIVEKLKAGGVNIYVANGVLAGQYVSHISVHIIPRFKDDKLSFGWKGKKLDIKDFKKIVEELKTNKLGEKKKKIKTKIVKSKDFIRRIP
jgi:histidine triad (HIT) family protein